MKVLCETNVGDGLPPQYFERGYSPSSTFDLIKGKEYGVYGMSLWQGLLLYLILGEGLYPHWYPSELFSLTRNEVPPDWHFAFFGQENTIMLNAVWGYDELVNTERHFEDLANLEEAAVRIFMVRKEQIDSTS